MAGKVKQDALMRCPSCKSDSVKKIGFSKQNKQRWLCLECHRRFADDTPMSTGSSYEAGENFINIVCSSPRMLSAEEVMDQFGVDRNSWKIDKFKVKTSEGYRKDRKVSWHVRNGYVTRGDVEDSGKMLVVPLYHVEVRLIRKTEEIRARSAVEDQISTAKKYAPKYKKIKYQRHKDGLLYEIDFPDLHFGRLAWHEESGADYDVKIASEYLRSAVYKLLEHTNHYPTAKIVIPVGNDYFNVNGALNTTAKGTPQQEDTRWQKTFTLGRKLAVEIIDLCSGIAPVDVLLIPGNHDPERLFYMGDALECWYSKNPNVTIDNRAVSRKYYQFGKNLIGFAHGANEKLNTLPAIMANDVPELWATSKFREWHTGDKHRKFDASEDGGIVIRILRSLAEPDAWTFNNGYMGQKAAEGFLWHPTKGLVAQFTASP